MEISRNGSEFRLDLRKPVSMVRPHFCSDVAQCCRPSWIRVRCMEDSSILVSLRVSSRCYHGRDSEEQPPRNASRPIKCSECKECETACPMQIPILDLDWKKFNDSECILCMACIDACPAGALSPKFP